MRAWRRSMALWLTVALGGACGGASTSDSNDAGGGDAGPSLPDTGAPDTGGIDAGGDASFCEANAAGHDFCEDFDRPIQIGGARWGRLQVDESTARLFQEDGVLHGEVLKIDGDNKGKFAPAWLWLERPWARLGDGTRPRVVLRYKLWVDECPVSGVSGPGVFGGVDREPWYQWTVDPLIFLDVDCRVLLWSFVHRTVDGMPLDGGAVSAQTGFLSIQTKQWLDVTMEVKEQADDIVKSTLRVGAQELTLETVSARSRIDTLSVAFGVSKSTEANVSARYLLDDLLVDHTKP